MIDRPVGLGQASGVGVGRSRGSRRRPGDAGRDARCLCSRTREVSGMRELHIDFYWKEIFFSLLFFPPSGESVRLEKNGMGHEIKSEKCVFLFLFPLCFAQIYTLLLSYFSLFIDCLSVLDGRCM